MGVVGMGRMGRLHARVFGEMPDHFALAGTFDPNGAREQDGTVAFRNIGTLVRVCGLVVVAAPTREHATIAATVLEAGPAVLVEKPLAATASEARRLAAASTTHPDRLFVGHSERFNPAVGALRSLLELEPPIAIDIERMVPAALGHDDIALNLGVHDVDLVEHLTGERVFGVEASGDGSLTRATMMAGTTRVTLRWGRLGHRRTIRVTTKHTLFEGDLLSPRLVAIDRASGVPTTLPLSAIEPLRAQALALHRALSGATASATSHVATGHEGARAVELAEMIAHLRDRPAPTGLEAQP